MRSCLNLFVWIGLFFSVTLQAQRESRRTLYLDAESWFLYEAYEEALPLYRGLLEQDPGNDNLKYKIGICLLHDPYQKDKSIAYLKDASDNINPDYKGNSYKERTAPPDVLFYLGGAYLVNELFTQAETAYASFLKVMDPEVYDEELVQKQIRSCTIARQLTGRPVDFDLTLMDTMINSGYAEINPVVSGNGKSMAYVTRLPFYDAAFFTVKSGTGWSFPQLITQQLGFDADIYPVSLSYDGTEMILYYEGDYIGNLYHSRLKAGKWQKAEKMGDEISTKYWESHGSLSRDGRTLYFTSNRKGTRGGLDIYKAERRPDGSWEKPVNLGSTVNSRYNEESPFICEDGKTLYFSSFGHDNMGGYDIFCSRLQPDGTWGKPVNMGYPINTTDDDRFFQPVNNGKGAYYSLYSPRGMGLHDIYYMNIYSESNPRPYKIFGTLQTVDGMTDPAMLAIYTVAGETGDTLFAVRPDHHGAFSFTLTQGTYNLHYTGEGYEELTRSLHITPGSDKEGIRLEEMLTRVKEETPAPTAKEEVPADTLEAEEGPAPVLAEEQEITAETESSEELSGETAAAEEEHLAETPAEAGAYADASDHADAPDRQAPGRYWPAMIIIGCGAGFLIFLIVLWRRRRGKER